MNFNPPQDATRFIKQTRLEGKGIGTPPAPPEMFGITSEQDLAWIRPRLSPQPIKTNLDPVRLSNPKATQIPRTYIYCKHPEADFFGQFANRYRTEKIGRSWN